MSLRLSDEDFRREDTHLLNRFAARSAVDHHAGNGGDFGDETAVILAIDFDEKGAGVAMSRIGPSFFETGSPRASGRFLIITCRLFHTVTPTLLHSPRKANRELILRQAQDD